MLSVAFTGVDHIALEACRERGIAVCNCAGYSTAAVADLVFGLLIGLYRRIPACDKAVRNGGTKDGLIGFELEGKNFGVVGTGQSARALRTLPRPLAAMSMHTAAQKSSCPASPMSICKHCLKPAMWFLCIRP